MPDVRLLHPATALPPCLHARLLTFATRHCAGTGKTLLARAVANRTDACFIRVIGSELVQKYVGEGARMVRELFQMARSKKACLIFFDEVTPV
jgi:ATP-dependent 26S proteasome regulatory subunit